MQMQPPHSIEIRSDKHNDSQQKQTNKQKKDEAVCRGEFDEGSGQRL